MGGARGGEEDVKTPRVQNKLINFTLDVLIPNKSSNTPSHTNMSVNKHRLLENKLRERNSLSN